MKGKKASVSRCGVGQSGSDLLSKGVKRGLLRKGEDWALFYMVSGSLLGKQWGVGKGG